MALEICYKKLRIAWVAICIYFKTDIKYKTNMKLKSKFYKSIIINCF